MAESDAFYIEVRDEATAVIKEFGTNYNIRKTGGTFDPATLTTGPKGATRSVTGLVADGQFAFNLYSQIYAVSETSAMWIGKRNLLLTFDAAPAIDEEIQVDGVWFNLGRIEPVKPAEIVVIYILDVTR